jgi:cytochrome c-type biogenesis protein CcsB
MNQGCLPSSGQSRVLFAPLFWCALFIIGLGLIGVMEYLETKNLTADIPLEQLFSYKLISYANLLLIVSTILYVAHLWFTARAVGLCATGLSTVGAFGLVVGLVARGTENYFMHRTGHIPLTSLYEVMSLFSTITVLIYLVMERVYRTRSAGAFVMPIVAAAVLFGAWLVSNDQVTSENHFSILRSVWIHAHVLANFIGYGAFAVAAAMGVMYLLRHDAENHRLAQGFAMRALPELPIIDRLMNQAISLGFPLFSFATMLGIMSANEAWGRYWAWDPKETWALIVWVTYAGYFYLRYARKWRGVRMAWWTIIGFGLTIFCFLGVNLFFSVLHSYG